MSKYTPLAEHLARQSREFIPMTFHEIEKIIDERLPKSARSYRAWWSNNPSNSVMTAAWLKAGYKSQDVDLAGERLVFHREPTSLSPASPGKHPLLDALKGMVRFRHEDLTAPAGAEWDAEKS